MSAVIYGCETVPNFNYEKDLIGVDLKNCLVTFLDICQIIIYIHKRFMYKNKTLLVYYIIRSNNADNIRKYYSQS